MCICICTIISKVLLTAMISSSVSMEHEIIMDTIEKTSLSLNIGHGFACVYIMGIFKSDSAIVGIVFSSCVS